METCTLEYCYSDIGSQLTWNTTFEHPLVFMPNKKKVPLIYPIILWLVTVLLGMEVAAKLLYIKGQGASAHYSSNWKLREICESFNHKLWEIPWVSYQPGISVFFEGEERSFTTSINAIGFRGADYTQSLKPNTVRIACFGGSTTVNGPSDLETYPALLEQFLNQRKENPLVRIMNCGVASMDSSSYYRTFDKLLAQNALPDIAIEYNGINSICWQLIPLWKLTIGPVQKLLLKSQFIKYFFGHCFIPDETQIRKDIQEYCITNIERLNGLLEKHNIPLFVASFACPSPSLCTSNELSYFDFNIRYWWQSDFISYRQFYRIMEIYNEELQLAFNNSNITYLPLAEYGDFGPDSFFDICHMKPKGIEEKAYILSRLIAPALK